MLAHTPRQRNWRRPLLYAALVSVAGAMAILCFRFLDPVGFRLTVLQPIREVAFFTRELEAFTHWGRIKTVTVSPSQHIRISATPRAPNDITIAADLWRPQHAKAAPAMILLHGSSPWGRKAGLIQLLAHHWYEKGWIVLAPDARGYGETDDPVDIDNPTSWTLQQDIERLIDYMATLEGVDPERIYVFGHSFGANSALAGALHDKRVKKVILVGPTRYTQSPEAPLSRWKRTRFSADRRLPRPIAEAVVWAEQQQSDIAQYASGILSRPGHPPILLMDGQHESAAERALLGQIARRIHPPITYRTLEGAGHYCGVFNLFGDDTVYFRPEIFQKLLDAMEAFIDKDVTAAHSMALVRILGS